MDNHCNNIIFMETLLLSSQEFQEICLKKFKALGIDTNKLVTVEQGKVSKIKFTYNYVNLITVKCYFIIVYVISVVY